MNREEFIIFTALTSYLKELDLNPAEYLSKQELLKYTEIGKDYLGMDTAGFREALKEIILEMAARHLK
ncbi:hypothetical protein [Paenibacillus zanthoxyli]|uniref:hypothetical protein n=1 Tax=Paenibacillus zanthoxyli TaxID=369399 RepID=UPI00046FB2BF|nr:hypothetical protein [Paenibacillus zanthoxyli]